MELDSVEGKKEDSTRLFTLMDVGTGFQIGRKYATSEASAAVLKEVEAILELLLPYTEGKEIVLLSDNGTEFDSLWRAEKEGVHVFYDTAYKSTDKPHCERNHEYFRYVIPKGISLDGYAQEDIDRIFSNVNSYSRNGLEWKSPCELFTEACSADAMKALGIRRIPPTEVDLSTDP